MSVFDRVAMPRIDIYDSKTNEFFGRVTFPVTSSVENAILGMINNAQSPGSFVVQDATFLPSSSSYVPPGIFTKYSRNAIIRAEFRDANSKLWMPADIYVSLDALGRGNIVEDKYHFDSLEYSNIHIQDMRVLPEGGSPQISST